MTDILFAQCLSGHSLHTMVIHYHFILYVVSLLTKTTMFSTELDSGGVCVCERERERAC